MDEFTIEFVDDESDVGSIAPDEDYVEDGPPGRTDRLGYGPGDLHIFITREALRKAQAHASLPSDDLREIGGVLVGHYRRWNNLTRAAVVIEDAIPALGALEASATIHFTPEAWDSMLAEIDAKHDGKVIVGWYHSHPGYDIFFSAVDKHSQELYYRKPWQVALVIDPFKKDREHADEPKYGFFRWKNGRFETTSPVTEYYRLANSETTETNDGLETPVEQAGLCVALMQDIVVPAAPPETIVVDESSIAAQMASSPTDDKTGVLQVDGLIAHDSEVRGDTVMNVDLMPPVPNVAGAKMEDEIILETTEPTTTEQLAIFKYNKVTLIVSFFRDKWTR